MLAVACLPLWCPFWSCFRMLACFGARLSLWISKDPPWLYVVLMFSSTHDLSPLATIKQPSCCPAFRSIFLGEARRWLTSTKIPTTTLKLSDNTNVASLRQVHEDDLQSSLESRDQRPKLEK
ncbi:unnamed protein product [Cyclocybe aegerita]|uniref:Secreted protein n=1 Tax=Cyclocybe aegerita TaxID=1973307 RepID=A0A8S0VWE3_CYCAE|nr:unnamed protein product [Cyclocybe aegerita]